MGSISAKSASPGPSPTAGVVKLSQGVVARLLDAGKDVKADEAWMRKLAGLQEKHAEERDLTPGKVAELVSSIRAYYGEARPTGTLVERREKVACCYAAGPPLGCSDAVAALAQAADTAPTPPPPPRPSRCDRSALGRPPPTSPTPPMPPPRPPCGLCPPPTHHPS